MIFFVLAGGEAVEVQDVIGSIVEPNSSNIRDRDTRTALKAYDNSPPNHVNQACNAHIKLDKHIVDFSNPQESQFGKGSNHFNDISIAVHDLIIPWSEIVLKEKIGAGMLIFPYIWHPKKFRFFYVTVSILKIFKYYGMVQK